MVSLALDGSGLVAQCIGSCNRLADGVVCCCSDSRACSFFAPLTGVEVRYDLVVERWGARCGGTSGCSPSQALAQVVLGTKAVFVQVGCEAELNFLKSLRRLRDRGEKRLLTLAAVVGPRRRLAKTPRLGGSVNRTVYCGSV